MGTQTVRTSTVRNLGPISGYPAHVGEPEAQALHRLARQAHERGIKLIVNQVTNHHFCTSASNRDKLHAVTLYSCDCRAFITHGRCMHLALVLEAYHSLSPIEPDPTPDGCGATVPVLSRHPGVEGVRTAYSGTRGDGFTYLILHADAVLIDGVLHRVGDRVLVTDRRWGWTEARITCIRTVGATGRVWKVNVDGTGYGETTRSLAEVRAMAVTVVAVSSEEVRHAA